MSTRIKGGCRTCGRHKDYCLCPKDPKGSIFSGLFSGKSGAQINAKAKKPVKRGKDLVPFPKSRNTESP